MWVSIFLAATFGAIVSTLAWGFDAQRKRREAEMLFTSREQHWQRRQHVIEMEEERLKNWEGRLKARELSVKAVEMLGRQMARAENAQELIDYLVNRDGKETMN